MRSRVLSHLARLCVAAALAFTVPAGATVVRDVSRSELVRYSDLIVHATVTGQHSEWSPDQSQIRTLTSLHVTSWLKGSGPEDLTLRQLGGTVGSTVMHVPGDAVLRQGDDVVLFLRRGEEDVVFLTALTLSAYHVEQAAGREPTVRRDLTDVTLARFPNGARMILEPPPSEPVESLDHLLRDIVAQVRRAP